MRRLPELAYEDLENLPEASEDRLSRLFERHTPEGISAWPEVDSVLHPYLHCLASLQLEFWIRTIGNDLDAQHFAAIYQHVPRHILRANGLDISDSAYVITNAADHGRRCVENAVFIDIRESVQDGERIFDSAPDGVCQP